jgi:regulator of sigma E protease
MENILYILRVVGLLIAGLSVLVIIHEFGHYLPARLFGMRVEKFYLFFDWPRKLFSFKKGDTEYGVGMIPLGGYVKISGIVDESMDTGQLAAPPQPHEFRSKPVWQRMIVMVGGVVMNVLLGMFIFALIFAVYGEEKLTNTPSTSIYVRPGTVGHLLGFRSGDRIVSFMGAPVPYLDEVMNPKVLLEDKPVFVVNRDGQQVTITIPSNFINAFADIKDPEKGILFLPMLAPVVKVDAEQGKLARELGLKDGDRLVSLNGLPISGTEGRRSPLPHPGLYPHGRGLHPARHPAAGQNRRAGCGPCRYHGCGIHHLRLLCLHWQRHFLCLRHPGPEHQGPAQGLQRRCRCDQEPLRPCGHSQDVGQGHH